MKWNCPIMGLRKSYPGKKNASVFFLFLFFYKTPKVQKSPNLITILNMFCPLMAQCSFLSVKKIVAHMLVKFSLTWECLSYLITIGNTSVPLGPCYTLRKQCPHPAWPTIIILTCLLHMSNKFLNSLILMQSRCLFCPYDWHDCHKNRGLVGGQLGIKRRQPDAV